MKKTKQEISIKPITAYAIVNKKTLKISTKDIYPRSEGLFVRRTEDELLVLINITPIEKDTTPSGNKSDEKKRVQVDTSQFNDIIARKVCNFKKAKQAKDKRTPKKAVGRVSKNNKG